jgi:hypothetical protein
MGATGATGQPHGNGGVTKNHSLLARCVKLQLPKSGVQSQASMFPLQLARQPRTLQQ